MNTSMNTSADTLQHTSPHPPPLVSTADCEASGGRTGALPLPGAALPPAPSARQLRLVRHLQRPPEWFSAFLAGNSREQTRFKREFATIRGSVVWLVRQRRSGHWTAHERTQLRTVMRSASSVSPYLLIWVVPGSLLLLPFLAWFIDRRRQGHPGGDSP